MVDDHLAQLAYEAYFTASGGISIITKDTLPSWYELPDDVSRCWIAAAKAVETEVENYYETHPAYQKKRD